jgi:hypothetical protein
MELRDLAPDSKMDFPCHTGRSASISQTQIELNTGEKCVNYSYTFRPQWPVLHGIRGLLCYTGFIVKVFKLAKRQFPFHVQRLALRPGGKTGS